MINYFQKGTKYSKLRRICERRESKYLTESENLSVIIFCFFLIFGKNGTKYANNGVNCAGNNINNNY